MLFNKSISKILLVTSVAALLAMSGGQAFAQSDTETPRIYVDPDTGTTTEIVKLPSEMTSEEMASYSVDELKQLKAIEAKLKRLAPVEN